MTEGRDRKAGRALAGRVAVVLLSAVLLASCGGRNRPRAVAEQAVQVTTIGVNAFLWRAALATLQFMPLQQVDSNGGVIITDWYQNPQTPGDRMKLTVTILDGALRADAVQVAAQREVVQNGQWAPAAVRAGTVQRLEEIILEKARDLRQSALAR